MYLKIILSIAQLKQYNYFESDSWDFIRFDKYAKPFPQITGEYPDIYAVI